MLIRGRELYNELQQIKNRKDFLPTDEEDFIQNLKSEYDYNCLRLAMDRFGSVDQAPTPQSNENKLDLGEIKSKLDKIRFIRLMSTPDSASDRAGV